MIISQKDIIFGKRVKSIIELCDSVPKCFLKRGDKKPKGCSVVIYDNDRKGGLYEGYCPIEKLIENLKTNSFHFLNLWQWLFYKIPVMTQKSFLTLSLIGVGTLYSANSGKTPFISRDFILDSLRDFIKNRRILSITRELGELYPLLFKELSFLSDDLEERILIWEIMILLLKIFLEGIKSVKNFS